MGSIVLSPGNPAKLGPLKMFFSLHIPLSLSVKIFVKHFRITSSNTIGLVLARSHFQSLPLEIGYKRLSFYDFGVMP